MTHDDRRRRLTVHAPAVLPSDAMVTFALFDGPSPELDSALRALGFWSSRYPDLRVGKAGQLLAALRAVEAAKAQAWKVANGAQQLLPATPDASAYASALTGTPCVASWADDVRVERGARLHLDEGRVLAWGEATLAFEVRS